MFDKPARDLVPAVLTYRMLLVCQEERHVILRIVVVASHGGAPRIIHAERVLHNRHEGRGD